MEDGLWSLTNGVLNGEQVAIPAGGYSHAYINNTNWTDYAVQGRIQFPPAAGIRGGGISGRLDPTTGARYAVWVYPEGSLGASAVLSLIKFADWAGSSLTVMETMNLPDVGTNSHIVELAFQSTNIAVYFDGVQEFTTTDDNAGGIPAFTRGGITAELGTVGIDYTVSFDDVIVRPLVADDTYVAGKDITLTVTAPGVLTNDTGVYGNSLTATAVSGPTNGNLTLNSDGSFSYTPTNDFVGTDSFVYQANDGTVNLGTATVTITVNNVNQATVTLGNLSQVYDGSAKSASATTVPPGLTVTLTYNGSVNAPTNAGSYQVIGTVVDANYAGSATNTLVINKATPSATLTVNNSPVDYDAAGQSAGVVVSTSSVGGSVANILTGGAASQTVVGTYAVTASFVPTDTNYNTLNGLSAGNFVINKATPTATLSVNNSPVFYNAAGQSANVVVSTSSVGGSVANILTGGAASQTVAGTYVVTADFVPGDTNYNTLTGLSAGGFVINKVTPTATLTVNNSPAVYDGTAQSANVVVSTSSVGGSVANILTGGAASQTAAGTYGVTADFVPTDTNYNTLTGQSAGDFVINKATPAFTGLSSLTNNYGVMSLILTGELSAGDPVYPANGDAVSATINGLTVSGTVTNDTGGFWINYNDPSLSTNGVSGSPYTITYNYAGNDAVSMGTASDSSTTLTIEPTTPVLTLVASGITYGQTLAASSLDGSAATNAENSAQVTGGFAFEDDTIAPNAGTTNVSVIFTPEDTVDYNMVTNAVSVSVDKAMPSATLTVNNSPVDYDAAGQSAGVVVSTSSVGGSVANILTGGAASQTVVGTYAVTADFVPDDTANYNTLPGLPAGDFVINAATPSATLSVNNSPVFYNAAGQSAGVVVSTSSVGGSVANILTGGAASQTVAGTYVVTADFVPGDTNYNTLTGLSAGDFVINKVTPTATLTVNNSPAVYDGTAKSASVVVSTSSVGGSVANILTGGAASQTAAGTYGVTADFVPTDTNYNTLTGQSAGDFVINKATPAFTGLSSLTNNYGVMSLILTGELSAGDPVYPANGDAVSATINGFTVSGTVTNDTGGFWINYNDPSLSTNGVSGSPYTITYNYAGNDAVSMGTASDSSTTLTIVPTTPVLTLVASGITYGQTLAASSLDGSAATNAENAAAVSGGFAFEDDTIAPNAGTTNVSAIFTPDDAVDYNMVTNAVSVTVDKAMPSATLTVNNSPVDYDAAGQSAGVVVSTSSVGGSVANILTGGAASQTVVGTYAVTADFVPDDTANYNTLPGLPAGDFVINAATPSATLSVNNSPVFYNAAGQSATVFVSASSVGGSVANILTGGAASQTVAGTYVVTADFVPGDTNYNTLTGLSAGDFVINKVTPTATLTVNNSPAVYDGTAKSASVVVSTSSVGGSVANILTGGAASQTAAGTYGVTADFVPTDTNYNTLTGQSAGDFVINKATPAFTGLSSLTNNYGVMSLILTGELSAGDPVYPANGDAVSATINGLTVSGTVTNDTGGFWINYNDPSLSTNGVSGSPYTITYNYAGNDAVSMGTASDSSTTLTIEPTTPVLTLVASGITYGQTLAASSLDGSAATNAENAAAVSGGFAFEDDTIAPNAGTTNVSAIFTPDDAVDYNMVTNAVSVTVDKAMPSATLTVNNSPVDYDAAGQSAGVVVSTSSVGGSVANILTGGAASQTVVGTYAVTADFVPDDTANYNTLPGLPAGDFVINAATPSATLSVNNSPVFYNAAGQSAGVVVSTSSVGGSVANILTGGAASQTVAGTYVVTADFVPGDTNYNTLTGLSAGDFVINKVTPTATLTVNNSPAVYDGTAKSASVVVSTSSVGGSVANILTGGAASQTAAGTYGVTADFVPTDTNYNTLTGQSAGDFVINKATPAFTGLSSLTNNYGVMSLILTGELSAGDPVYPANGDAVSATINGFTVSGTVTNDTGGFWINYNDPSLSTNGVSGSPYTITYNYAGNDAVSMGTASDSSTTLTIVPTTPVLTLVASGITYGQTLAASSLDGSAATNAENAAAVSGGFAFEDDTIAPNAGTTNVSAIFTPDDAVDYNMVTNAVSVTVDKAMPSATLTVNNSPVDYDAAGQSAGVVVSTSSVGGSVANILTGGAASQTVVGTYAVTADFVPDDTANYNTLPGLPAGDFVINAATPSATLSVNNSPVFYDAAGQSAGVVVSTSSVGGSVANILTGGAASQTVAGTYVVTADFVPGDTNYNTLTGLSAGDFVINKVTPTATLSVNNSPTVYDGTAQSANVVVSTSSVSGNVANILTGGAASQTAAGTYGVTADFVPTDTNYNTLTGQSAGDFVINKATPAFTGLTSLTNNYGVMSLILTGELSAGDPVYPANGDAVSATINGLTVSGTVTNDTGGFWINYNDPSLSTNGVSGSPYTITYNYAGNDAVSMGTASDGSTTLTIEPTTPVLTLVASGITYGQTLAASSMDGSAATNAENSAQVTGGFAFEDDTIAPNAGTTNVSVIFTPEDTVDYNDVTNTVTVSVGKQTPLVSTAFTATGITYGQTLASSTPSGALTNAAGAAVPGGFAFANSAIAPNAGTTNVSVIFTPTDAADYNDVTNTVTVSVGKQTPGVSTPFTASAITYGQTLASSTPSGALTNAAGAAVPGGFAFANSAIAPNAGTTNVSVIFTPTDAADYNDVTNVVSVSVGKQTPGVSTPFTATGITYGQTLASSTPSGALTNAAGAAVPGGFAFANSAIAPNAGTTNVSVIFTPTDAADYNNVTNVVSVSVGKQTPGVSTAFTATGITYGQTLASSTPGGALTNAAGAAVPGGFAFANSAIAPNAGTTNVSVIFTPTDAADYNDVTNVVSVSVGKQTPGVSTPFTATGITYGQTLASSTPSGALTNAAGAAVPGGFAFANSAIAPNAGTTNVSVIFTPTDAADYNNVTNMVSVSVGKQTPGVSTAFTATGITYGQTLASSTPGGALTNAAGAAVPGGFAFANSGDSAECGDDERVGDLHADGRGGLQRRDQRGECERGQTDAGGFHAVHGDAITYGQTLASSTPSGALTNAAGAAVPGGFAFANSAIAPNAGTTNVSVIFTPTDAADYNDVTNVVSVSVGKQTPVVSTAFTATGITYGQTLASSTPSGALTNAAGAAVPGGFAFANSGIAPNAGTTNVSVIFTPTDAADYNDVTNTVTVSVGKQTPGVSTPFTASAITYGQTLASSTPSGALTNAAGAAVPGGFAFANSAIAPNAGTTNVSVIFTPTDAADYNNVTNVVSVSVGKQTPGVSTPFTATGITYGQTLASSTPSGALTNAAGAAVPGGFAFANSAIAPNAGTTNVSVIFTPTDAADYNNVTNVVSVSVGKQTPLVSTAFTATGITYGQTLASSTPSGALTNAAGAAVPGGFAFTNSGIAPNAGTTNVSVIFTPTDAADYNNVTNTVTVSVGKQTPGVSTPFTASAITYGQTLASSTPSGALTNAAGAAVPGGFAFANSAIAPNAGTTNVSVIFTPTDAADYNNVTNVVSVSVGKQTPGVSTAFTATGITYGQTLASSTPSGALTNAAGAAVPGGFAFANSAIAPNAGTTNVSVIFTPTDAADYNNVTNVVSVSVGKQTPVVSTAFTATGITYGQTLASSTPSGALTNAAGAAVPGGFAFTNSGIAPNAGTTNVSVIFTPTDAADYNNVTNTVTVSGEKAVGKQTPGVSTAFTATGITYGQTLASSTPSGALTMRRGLQCLAALPLRTAG